MCVYISGGKGGERSLNREAFTEKAERSRHKLLRIARSMLRPCDCEDAVQSAILSAWEHLLQLRNDDSFDAWLVQILVNRCRQIQRGYQRDKDVQTAILAKTQETQAGQSAVNEALEELSGQERRLIEMHHIQGYTLREISKQEGGSEEALKMRLYRARKRLKIILISLLLPVLLASAAIGAGWLDVEWFMVNRRAEPAAIGQAVKPQLLEIAYSGEMLEASISDAVWDAGALSLSAVYSVAGKDPDAIAVYSGQIGVDGVRHGHIFTEDGVFPLEEWANGRRVQDFSIEGWRLDGRYLAGEEDCLADGRGETFFAEWGLDLIAPQQYGELLETNGTLNLTADVTLEDAFSGEILEEGILSIRVNAPSAQEWREWYEAYFD